MALMSHNIYYLGVAGSLASLALGPGIWALVDASTHTRQVCASTSDNDVKNAQILDFAHFATCLLVFALPLYRLNLFGATKSSDTDGTETKAPMIELAYAFMFVSFGLLVGIVTISSTVCSNNNCITTDAAHTAQLNEFGLYNAQLEKMLGVEGGGDASSAVCGLNPSHFKVPGNYCPENLIGLPNCPNLETPGGAEKCLVFACNNLVEGRQSRFVISLVGLLLQIIATYFVILFENTPATLAPASGGMGSSLVQMGVIVDSADSKGVAMATEAESTMDSELLASNRSTLQALRRRPADRYSSRPGKLAF